MSKEFLDDIDGHLVSALIWGPTCDEEFSYAVGDWEDSYEEIIGTDRKASHEDDRFLKQMFPIARISTEEETISRYGELTKEMHGREDESLKSVIEAHRTPLLLSWKYDQDSFESAEEFSVCAGLFDNFVRAFSFSMWKSQDLNFGIREYDLFWAGDSQDKAWEYQSSEHILDHYALDRDRITINFDREQITSALELAWNLYHDTLMEEHELGDSRASFNVMEVGIHGTMGRFMHLVNTARQEVMLPYRIAAYFTALECLLTRDASDVAHTVAERASLLMCEGALPQESVQLYKRLKNCYNIRSRFVHGGFLGRRSEVFRESAEFLDTTLRQLLVSDEGGFRHQFLFERMTSAKFNDIFLLKLFGDRGTPNLGEEDEGDEE